MPTYVDYGGRVNSTIVGWVEVTADTEYSLGLRGPPIVTLEFPFVGTNSRALTIDKTGTITEGCPRVMRFGATQVGIKRQMLPTRPPI